MAVHEQRGEHIPVNDPQYQNLIALGRIQFIETSAGAPTHFRATEAAYFDTANLDLYINAGGGNTWTKVGPGIGGGGGFSGLDRNGGIVTLSTTFQDFFVSVAVTTADTYLFVAQLTIQCLAATSGLDQIQLQLIDSGDNVVAEPALIRRDWVLGESMQVVQMWRVVATGAETFRLQAKREGTAGSLRTQVNKSTLLAFAAGVGGGGTAPHNIVSSEHPDTAGVPANGELLQRVSGNWVGQQPDQHGDHHLSFIGLRANLTNVAPLLDRIQLQESSGILVDNPSPGQIRFRHAGDDIGNVHPNYQLVSEKNIHGGYGNAIGEIHIVIPGPESV